MKNDRKEQRMFWARAHCMEWSLSSSVVIVGGGGGVPSIITGHGGGGGDDDDNNNKFGCRFLITRC